MTKIETLLKENPELKSYIESSISTATDGAVDKYKESLKKINDRKMRVVEAEFKDKEAEKFSVLEKINEQKFEKLVEDVESFLLSNIDDVKTSVKEAYEPIFSKEKQKLGLVTESLGLIEGSSQSLLEASKVSLEKLKKEIKTLKESNAKMVEDSEDRKTKAKLIAFAKINTQGLNEDLLKKIVKYVKENVLTSNDDVKQFIKENITKGATKKVETEKEVIKESSTTEAKVTPKVEESDEVETVLEKRRNNILQAFKNQGDLLVEQKRQERKDLEEEDSDNEFINEKVLDLC